MRVAGSHRKFAGRSTQALLGWLSATTVVLAAGLGPPLTGQSVPTATVVELRHDVLMIDRELEGLTMQTKTHSDKYASEVAETSHDG
jgi:hypothetical protein